MSGKSPFGSGRPTGSPWLIVVVAIIVALGAWGSGIAEALLQAEAIQVSPEASVVPAATDTVAATDTPVSTDTPTDTPVPTDTVAPTNTATIPATATNTAAAAPTQTSTPAPAAPIFSDGFESGNLSLWTKNKGMIVQQQEVLTGSFAARATTSSASVYARTTLSAPTNDIYVRVRLKIVSRGSGTLYLLRLRSPADATVLGVYVTSGGWLGLRNDISGIQTTSSTAVSIGAWHEIQIHAVFGSSGSTQVWLDDVSVPELSSSQAFGSAQMGILQIGENTAGRQFDVAFDDIATDSAFIQGQFIPGPTSTPVPTATLPPTATPTNTSTPPPTATLTPVPTSTATPVPTETATTVPTDTATLAPTVTATTAPTDTSTPLATDTATPIPTDTATAIPTETLVSTPTETATVLSTDTPTPVATETQAPTATATSTDTATPLATVTATATDTTAITSTPTETPTTTATTTVDATWTPTAAPLQAQGSVSFSAVADTYVSQGAPSQNFGTSATLWVDGGGDPVLQTYIRFSLTGLTQNVTQATLWLYSSNGSINGPSIFGTSTGWSETGLNWNTRVAPTGNALATVTNVPNGTWIPFNVTGAITGNGDFAFVLVPNSTDAAGFNSRNNAANQPHLDLTLGTATSPTPTATATATPPVTATPTATVVVTGTPTPTAVASGTPTPTVVATGTSTPTVAVTPTVTPTATATATPLVGGSVTLVAAGDIVCGQATSSGWCKQAQTASVVQSVNPDVVLALGDVQYECAEMADFHNFFDPTWGQFKGKIRPTTGNHEYKTGAPCVTNKGDAAEYFAYFGNMAGDPSKGYYSFDLGAWHIIALNSNCSKIGSCNAGSPEETWLRQDLASHPAACTLAYMHYPRFSTVATYPNLIPLWQALYDYNAEIVLAAHDHHYERYGPRDANGNSDSTRGIVEFIVGTGGKQPNQSFGSLDSPLKTGTVPGVLKLTLNANSYSYQFVPVPGYTFNESGSGACHGSSANTGTGALMASTGSSGNGAPPSAASAGFAIGGADRTSGTFGLVSKARQAAIRVADRGSLAQTPVVLIWLLVILLTMFGLIARTRSRARRMPLVRLMMATIPGARLRRKIGAVVAALVFAAAVLSGPASAHEIASTGTAAQSSQLGSALVPNLPPGPTTMAMARFTMDPGAKLEDFGVPGPEIIVVESGIITVGVRGETEDEEDIQAMLDLLKRATPDTQPPATPSGDLFSYAMTAGDRLVVPPDMPQNVQNMGTGPATFVAAAVTPVAPRQQDQPWPPAGVGQSVPTTGTTIQPMGVGYDVSALLGTNAAILSIERMTFAPGATYSITDNHTPQVWYIEQGSMQFSGADSAVWYSKPASAWHGESAGTPTPDTGAFLVAGDAVQLDARATLTFSSAGSGPVIATVFSVSTEQPLATPDS